MQLVHSALRRESFTTEAPGTRSFGFYRAFHAMVSMVDFQLYTHVALEDSQR